VKLLRNRFGLPTILLNLVILLVMFSPARGAMGPHEMSRPFSGIAAGLQQSVAPASQTVAQDASQQAPAPPSASPLPAPAEPYIPPPPPGVSQAVTQNNTGNGQGQVSGNVTDQTGAVVVGATVKLSSPANTFTATTDEKGAYYFRKIPAGSYSLVITAANFKQFQADNVQVAAEEVPLDAALEPAAAKTEQVNVEASNAAAVETLNAEVSGTITQKEVVNLGLNGRNFTQFITLTPGVSNQTGQDEAKVGVQGSVKYSVNGGRVEYNSFEVDGSDVLNAGLSGAESTLVVYPSLDAIQELKVLTSNYGAQYGRTASGTVQVTTKSGGSAWHGNAYYFLRNEAFNARNYFDPPGRAPLYRRNDMGFTIGGPLTIPGHYNTNKDKTFIFFSEEYRLEKSPSDLQPTFNHAVPSLAERQGDFSDVCPNPNDPTDLKKLRPTGALGSYYFPVATFPDCPGVPNRGIPGFRQMFGYANPNGIFVYNHIFGDPTNPTAGLDPNAAAILNQNLIPLPNSFNGCSSSLVGQTNHTTGQTLMPCYNAVISLPTHWREELLRLDHNFNTRFRLTVRAIHDSWDTVTPTPNWGTVRNSFPTVQNKFVGPGVDLMTRLTQTLSPTLVNETVFSFTNSTITLTNQNGPGGANFMRPAALGDPAQVGNCSTNATGVPQCPFGYIFNNGFGGKVPGLVLAGNNQAYGGAGFIADPSYMPWQHTNPTYNIRDDISKALGKHTLQLGFQYVLAQKNETNGALESATGDLQGLLTVSNVNGGAYNTGNAFANFLYNNGFANNTGGGNAIQSFTQDSAQLRYYNRYQIIEPYVQDDWKLNSKLTLNLGIRFSLFGNYSEKYRNAYNWDPKAYSISLAAQTRVDPFTGQLLDFPGSKPLPLDLTNLDPRITNGLVRCGTNRVPAGCAQSHVFNPAPRVGFAWDPKGNGKMAIRAGYGLFWEHGTGDEANTGSLEGSAPLVLSLTQPFPISYACIGNYGPECNPNGRFSLPGAYPINVTSIPTETRYSYSQQWSLSIQRELPHNFVSTFAYVGSKGTHLSVERQLNQLHPVNSALNPFAIHEPFLLQVQGAQQGDCDNSGSVTVPQFVLQNGVVVSSVNPAVINLQIACQGEATSSASSPVALTNTFRPYPGFAQIFSLQNAADSSYHGFQTVLRRTKGALTAGVAYSYSHSIDDSSDRTDPTFVNTLDLRSNKASSNFDQRHLLNLSYVYSLPKLSQFIDNWTSGSATSSSDPNAASGASVAATPSHLARILGDGWQISGITSFQSGTPFSVVNNGGSSGIAVSDNAGVANGVGVGSFPDVIPHASVYSRPFGGSNASSFGPILLNPGQFVAPRGLTFGDAGRNFLNNPNRLNFDISLLKHFAIHEGSEIEFRMEAFNIFNHTQFRLYNPDRGNTGSNTISCYGGSNYSAGAYFPGGDDCLTGSAFLHPVDAHRGRTMQFALKYSF